MLNVDTIHKIRQAHFRDGKGIREIARDFNLARNTVKRIIRSGVTDQIYERRDQPRPKLGSFIERLSELLKEDTGKPVRHRKSAQILFEQLQREGYEGGYDFADLEELNEWLADECRHHAATAKHPELKDKTVDQVFAAEKPKLLPLPVSPFDGYQESVARVSPQLLINFDRNRYSVNAMTVGKTVQVRAYASRIIVVMNGITVAVHKRHFGRDKVIYDPWHYLAVLERKPGALRNGAPFRQWELPESMTEVRKLLEVRPDGDRQFIGILTVVGRYGLEPVASACTQALSDRTVSRDIILAILSKRHDEQPPAPIKPSAQLPLLTVMPVADCKRYDRLDSVKSSMKARDVEKENSRT